MKYKLGDKVTLEDKVYEVGYIEGDEVWLYPTGYPSNEEFVLVPWSCVRKIPADE